MKLRKGDTALPLLDCLLFSIPRKKGLFAFGFFFFLIMEDVIRCFAHCAFH